MVWTDFLVLVAYLEELGLQIYIEDILSVWGICRDR